MTNKSTVEREELSSRSILGDELQQVKEDVKNIAEIQYSNQIIKPEF